MILRLHSHRIILGLLVLPAFLSLFVCAGFSETPPGITENSIRWFLINDMDAPRYFTLTNVL